LVKLLSIYNVVIRRSYKKEFFFIVADPIIGEQQQNSCMTRVTVEKPKAKEGRNGLEEAGMVLHENGI